MKHFPITHRPTLRLRAVESDARHVVLFVPRKKKIVARRGAMKPQLAAALAAKHT